MMKLIPKFQHPHSRLKKYSDLEGNYKLEQDNTSVDNSRARVMETTIPVMDKVAAEKKAKADYYR